MHPKIDKHNERRVRRNIKATRKRKNPIKFWVESCFFFFFLFYILPVFLTGFFPIKNARFEKFFF